MIRALACLLAVASSIAAMPDAVSPPATRWHPEINITGGIEFDEVWRDEDLAAILNRPGAPEPLDDTAIDAVLHPAPERNERDDLTLDPQLSDEAEGLSTPPPVDEDLPLQ